MSETHFIEWRLHLAAPPAVVYAQLAEADGRAAFWAEAAPEVDGHVEFTFANAAKLRARILERDPGRHFALEYFGGSVLRFDLTAAPDGGTDLVLREQDVARHDWLQNLPGWVAVLLCLKGAVDHGIDLRNHDPARTWDGRWVDG